MSSSLFDSTCQVPTMTSSNTLESKDCIGSVLFNTVYLKYPFAIRAGM